MNDYADAVRGYLAYCERAAADLKAAGSSLDLKYHPTADGCVKFVPHRGDAGEAKKIRAAFGELAGEVA